MAKKPTTRSTKDYGIYLGIVKNVNDLTRNGTMDVFIPVFGNDPTRHDGGVVSCRWSSPFAGSTDPTECSNIKEEFVGTQKSYGMWMVPPDVNNQVLVCFADGDNKRPIVISTLFADNMNHMVPGMPAGETYGNSGMLMPAAEKSRFDPKSTHNDAVRPVHVDIAEAITLQGLINDPVRGAGSSGARRDPVSQVFGILTPGPRDPKNWDHRLGGHQFVMDDSLESRQIRLRTAQGAQLLLDDTNGIVYVINKKGTGWVEIANNGDIHVYSAGSINMRAKGNFNLRADKNVNIEAGQDVHIKAAGDNTGSKYLGIPGLGSIGLPPLGNGGNIRMEAAADLSQFASLNAQLTASGGDVDISAGSRLAATSSGPLGTQILAATGPVAISSPTRASMLGGVEASITSAGPTTIMGTVVLLNSGGAPALPALPAVPAAQIGTNTHKDAADKAPDFDRDAANKGKTASKTGGKRTGTVANIKSIVTAMPTAEPWIGHGQYSPTAAPAPNQTKFNQAAMDEALPEGADVQTPNGSFTSKQITDESGAAVTSGQATDIATQVRNTSETATGAINSAAQGANTVIGDVTEGANAATAGINKATQMVQNAENRIKKAAEQKLLEITGLNGLVDGIKAAIPPIRFPTSNALSQKIIGIGKQLSELEAQLKQFAVDLKAELKALDELRELAELRKAISGLMAAGLAAYGTFAALQAAAAKKGIRVIQDGPGLIYEDSAGNRIVDFSNGLGDIGLTLATVGEMNTTWNSVNTAINVQITENQALALASFASQVGAETFLQSNLLEALNAGKYEQVPYIMSGWVNDASGNRSEALAQRRAYEASLFQTPDNVDITVVDSDDYIMGGSTFEQLRQTLDGKRNDFIIEDLRNQQS